MPNWVTILRRILGLYKVTSLQDLGMALGAPLDADSLPGGEIPWPILERVAAEKGVSWDWLLTGRGEGDGQDKVDPKVNPESVPKADPKTDSKAGAKPDNVTPRTAGMTPPRIETREFTRVLLDGEKGEERSGDNPEHWKLRELDGAENNEAMLEAELLPKGNPEDAASLLARLKDMKTSMQQEIDRIDRILRERGSGK